jgi:hypothetical protein
MSSQYSELSAATLATIDTVVAKYPNTCARDILPVAYKVVTAAHPGAPLHEVDMYVFLVHRPDCGMDCDEQCPVTGKPCNN